MSDFSPGLQTSRLRLDVGGRWEQLRLRAATHLPFRADVIITAESKGIPLGYEMCRLSGKNRYVLARKSVKLYMKDVVKCETQSITTSEKQVLYIDGDDAAFMKGKRVLIVDDVISTGGSLLSLENLVKQAGGKIVGKMAVLAEGDAIDRSDIICLAPLPLFDKDGNIV